MSSRKARKPYRVVYMQRLHDDDYSMHRIEKGKPDHIVFPMEYEKPSKENKDLGRWLCPCHQKPDTLDPRTESDELLFPALFSRDIVNEMKDDLDLDGPGQLQQRPQDLQGGFFKRDWFRIVDSCPSDTVWCRGWDTAATEDAGDWTVGVKMGYSASIHRFYIADVVRVRVEDADIIIEQTALIDGKSCMIREETEGGSSGKKVIKAHLIMLVGYDFEGVPITGSKATRARPFRKECRAHNVDILIMSPPVDSGDTWKYKPDQPVVQDPDPIFDTSWIVTYLNELCAFPLGKHDDQVDASSCAFNALAVDIEKKQEKRGGAWGRRAVKARAEREAKRLLEVN